MLFLKYTQLGMDRLYYLYLAYMVHIVGSMCTYEELYPIHTP